MLLRRCMVMREYNLYNESIKKRFLNSIDLEKYPPNWWDRVFDKSYIFEELYHRDLYDFSTSNLLEFFKYLDFANINSLVVYKANLIKYVEWAISENLVADNQIHLNELTMELLTGCISKARVDNAIISYDKLREMHFVNAQDAFVFWCLFEGIKGKDFEEIINLKIDDIDKKNHTVKLSDNRVITVSEYFISACENAWREDEYIALKGEKTIKLIQSLYIFKEKSNSRGIDKRRSVYNTIIRNIHYFSELANDVTAKSIRDSGLIYYLNKRADEYGMTVDELFYDMSKCGDIIDKYHFNTFTRKRWMMMYHDYLH